MKKGRLEELKNAIAETAGMDAEHLWIAINVHTEIDRRILVLDRIRMVLLAIPTTIESVGDIMPHYKIMIKTLQGILGEESKSSCVVVIEKYQKMFSNYSAIQNYKNDAIKFVSEFIACWMAEREVMIQIEKAVENIKGAKA